MKKRVSPQTKVRTSLSLSKTKPVKPTRLGTLKKRISSSFSSKVKAPEPKLENNSVSDKSKPRTRIQPESKIAYEQKLSLWFIPARFAYFFSGLYYLGFSIMGFLGVFSNYNLIKPFFTLPFDSNFSSFFLLEIASVFALISSFLFFYSSRHPKTSTWFYYFLILLYLPYHFLSNLQKMQIELPQNFQNYLYFDTIITAVFWGMFILSIYPYLKSFSKKS